MVIIDERTRKAIIKNKSLLITISRERIWEEIKKSWEQSKDFNSYLELLTEFNMWSEIFPDSVINTEFINSKNFTLVIANLFKLEKTVGLERKMVQVYKMESDIVKKVIFLVDFLLFEPEMVFDLYKKKQQCSVDDNTLSEWLKVNNITDKWKFKFIDYRPSVSSKHLMDMGYSGAELGRKIKEMEIENFKRS